MRQDAFPAMALIGLFLLAALGQLAFQNNLHRRVFR